MNLIFKDFIYLDKEEAIEILRMRNSEYVRRNMHSSGIIQKEDHLCWIEGLKNDKSSLHYAVFCDEKIVGAINITKISPDKERCSWGLYFKEGTSPLVSSISAYLMIDKVFYDFGILQIVISVKKFNKNAYRFDTNLGFVENGKIVVEKDEYIKMSMDRYRWKSVESKPLLKTLRKKINTIEYKFIGDLK